MDDRYFIDKNGSITRRIQGRPGQGHIEIAREVLATRGVEATRKADLYAQIFRQRYVRVVEFEDGAVEVEYGGKLSGDQKRIIKALQARAARLGARFKAIVHTGQAT